MKRIHVDFVLKGKKLLCEYLLYIFSLNKCALIYTVAAFDFIENNAFLTKHINTFPQLTCSANTINI